MTDRPVTARDLPPEKFPITIRAFGKRSGREVWTETLTEGPGIIEIPPLARQHGEPMAIRVEYGDGTVEGTWPT